MLILFFVCIINVNAQKASLPKNPDPGKCYVKCLEYDKPTFFKEVDCDSLKITIQLTEKALIKKERYKLKLIAYQKKLLSLDYDVIISGCLDDKTEIAHNNYIRKKIKAERKVKRKEKQKKRLQLNN